MYLDRSLSMYLDRNLGLRLSLSEITLLFDLSMYLHRTLAQSKVKVTQCAQHCKTLINCALDYSMVIRYLITMDYSKQFDYLCRTHAV